MADRVRPPWVAWAFVAGAFAICCGLPIVALIVLAAGGAAALVTGAFWVAFAAVALAAVLGGFHMVRRRATTGDNSFVPLERRVHPSERHDEPLERKE